MFIADHDFLETFSMKMDTGRFFSRDFPTDSSGIIINQAASKLFETPGVMGRTVSYSEENIFRVIGIIKNFHYESFHQIVRPAAFLLTPGIWGASINYMAVKMTGDNIAGTLRYLENKWDEYSSGLPIEYTFFDDEYDKLYLNEKRTGKILTLFSILAVLIASLGLLGLSAFITEQRTKEIGIRKVQGATTPKILILLCMEFNKWILLAAILAFPAAYLLMKDWLENFAYRIEFPWFSFIISAVMAIIIALITISFQTTKAAFSNPAESLRHK